MCGAGSVDGVTDGMTVADANQAIAADISAESDLFWSDASRRRAEVLRFPRSADLPATAGVRFLKFRFDPLQLKDAAQVIVERAERAAAFAYVVTPNVDHRVRLEREPELNALYETAWMSLCDSRILQLLARFDGLVLPASPGADLVEYLFEECIRGDDVINIVGNDSFVVSRLRERYSLRNVNHHVPPRGLRQNSEALAAAAQFVAEHPARFTFICVGSPQQEMIAQRIVQRGDAKGVAICCGAALEFLSGRVPRAPRWMRNVALEWLHRLATDPLRMYHRYLIAGPAIVPIWLRERRACRQAGQDEFAQDLHGAGASPRS